MGEPKGIDKVMAENIERFMAEREMSDRDVAREYGCEENFIYRLRKGQKPAGKETIVKLARILKKRDVDFYAPKEAEGMVRVVQRGRYVPVFKAITGPPKEYTDQGYPVGMSDRQEIAETRDENAFFVEAEGDSMIGDDIREGDLLLIEPNKEVRHGGIVFCRHEGKITVKRFFRGKDYIELRPMNPKHASIFIREGEGPVVVFPVTHMKRSLLGKNNNR